MTEANDLMRTIHDRMPDILADEDYDRWLDPKIVDAARIQSMLKPCHPQWLQAYPVSQAVNNSRNEGEELIKPLPSSLFDFEVGDKFKGYSQPLSRLVPAIGLGHNFSSDKQGFACLLPPVPSNR